MLDTHNRLDNITVPVSIIKAISFFSAVTGTEFSTRGVTEQYFSWSSFESNGYVATLHLISNTVTAVFNPETEEEWSITYQLIGYCAYHQIKWIAP